jgi:hydrogenase expression/formation protein HypC
MCLAIPGKLTEITEDPYGVRMGKANFGGIVKQVCLQYTPEVQTGDYVLVHVGFALGKVDEAEAERTYQALADMEQLGELETPESNDSDDPFAAAPSPSIPP